MNNAVLGRLRETFDYHHGQEHRLSRHYVFESLQLQTLRRNSFRHVHYFKASSPEGLALDMSREKTA